MLPKISTFYLVMNKDIYHQQLKQNKQTATPAQTVTRTTKTKTTIKRKVKLRSTLRETHLVKAFSFNLKRHSKFVF